ncbi:hypothetical protein [Endozoicomonas sp. 8E]|uniref:hypothetical protein n=1 Tax=Endozoicomonas sp. 8E TaxID=3035692 RepID=UPI0029393136|nr:hypothetical protein [Endozoicomonas sp. 8E]WOG26972.1 hypothetical protein P6910_20840 [Endozoicomonas sp. 8E]
MIKHSIFAASLLLLHSLFAIGQANPLTRYFIVEFQQVSGFPNQSFSIKQDRCSLSGSPSVIADTSACTGQDLPPYYKRQKPIRFEVNAAFIESISLRLLCLRNLLVAFELILTSRDAPLSFAPYSWLPIETIVAFGWLLKSYWKPDSTLLNLIRQQEMSQDHPFVITAMMPGSGNNQQQSQPSGSSGLQTSAATIQPQGYSTSLLHSGFNKGNENPQQQHRHTLGLDCFVHPCYGICKFRPPSESVASSTEATPGQNSCPRLANRYSYLYIRHSDPAKETSNDSPAIRLQYVSGQLSRAHGIDGNPANSCNSIGFAPDSTGAVTTDIAALAEQTTCNATVIMKDGHLRQCTKAFKSAQTLSNHKKRIHTGQKNCEVTVVGENGQQQPCGVVCKNDQSLASHKSKYHRGPKTCDLTETDEDGLQRRCGKVCKNAEALSSHKRRHHTALKTCDVFLIGKDGQQRPCGTICMNPQALWYHKRRTHTGQQTCDVITVGKDGQQQACGKVYKNIQTLSDHKRKYHTRQRTCNLAVVGDDGRQRPCEQVCKNSGFLSVHKRRYHTEQKICGLPKVGKDGQQRPCRKICMNAQIFSEHKSKVHSGQKTCGLAVVGKDSNPQPCGKLCKNARALSDHKRRKHTGQQTCNLILVDEDGQQRPCGRVCKNTRVLSDHKRTHRKRKSVDVNMNNELSSPKVESIE